MTNDGQVFRLFACNVPVAGASRAIVCDLQRGELFHIPMELYTLLTEYEGRTLGEIKAELAPEVAERVDAAFALLLENDLGVWLDPDEAARFPAIDLARERPATLDNAIIDVNRESRHDYPAIFAQLDELGCAHVELRFYDPVGLDELDRILEPTRRGRLRSIQLVVPYAGWSAVDFERLWTAHPRIATISVHGAPTREVLRPGRKLAVSHFRQRIESSDACGRIHPGYFSINLETFSEAQKLNTCLSGKVGIDVAGKIKNCPSCTECFGDAGTTRLSDVVQLGAFRRLWNVQRDQVDVCRDCEYRYICTDCRAFVSDPLAKPAKCNYDPYAGEWRVLTPAPSSGTVLPLSKLP